VTQAKLPTMDDAIAARDEGMARADRNASGAWKDAAYSLVARLNRGTRFTADSVWDLGLPKPRNPRALGPVIMRLRREGVIQWTGLFTPSRYRHATPMRIWERT
jgi:hypothetical protein